MQIARVVIIGAGAVGGCIGGFLAKQGFPTTFVARGQHGQTIQEKGLLVKRPQQSFSVQVECHPKIDSVNWREGDVAILATKLNDAESALDDLLLSAGTQTPVVCATNGIHAELWAAKRFDHVISMMIWMPTTYLVHGEVEVYGGDCPGVLDCGAVDAHDSVALETAKQLCERLTSAGFDSVFRKNIEHWKNAKWITNLANTAQALVEDDWKSVAKAAQLEGIEVLEKAGKNRISREDLRDRTECVNLLPIDGRDRPGGSTWQSLQRDKPLESPWLEGAIVELGLQIGMPTPINQCLSDASKTLRKLKASEVLG